MEQMTFPEFIAQITLEEETRVHEAERINPELYNSDAFESNMGRAVSMSYPVTKRINLAKGYAYLRHRELFHEEDYGEEKAIIKPQMVKADVETIEEGIVNYGWWRS